MRRAVGSVVISSLFLFLLTLPLLHLHPNLKHTLGAVIHCHMPHDAEIHHGGATAGPILDDVDSDELRALPFEISALCAAAAAQAPVPEFCAMLPMVLRMGPDMPSVCFTDPDPRAQAPPGILIHPSFRGPPA